jgi:hypothetical protein
MKQGDIRMLTREVGFYTLGPPGFDRSYAQRGSVFFVVDFYTIIGGTIPMLIVIVLGECGLKDVQASYFEESSYGIA